MSFKAKVKLLEDTFNGSAEFQMAHEAYWDEIVRPGILKRGSTKTDQPVPAPFMHFLHNTVRNLFLFGYSVYRRLEKGEYVVPSGATLSIRFDCDEEKWVADTDKDADDFSVIVFSPPTEVSPVSYATAALSEIIRLNSMHEQRTKRDAYNSKPTVFATVDHNAMDKDKGVTAIGRGTGVDDTNSNYENYIQMRAQILQTAKEATDTLNREHAGFGSVGAGIERPAQQGHIEYYVADGRRAEQARHLHGPADELHAIIKQRHIALQAAGCPPQVIGETPSSERVSGAERSTGQAIEAFAQRCKEIRMALMPVLRAANYEWGKRMRPDMFERIYSVLNPDAAASIMSQMFFVSKADFDLQAIAEDQETRRGVKRAAAEGEPEERKTNYTKHADVEKRAEPPV